MQNLFCVIISPPITVCSIDVYTKIQQELDYVVMSCTHCIVQGCDALVVGSARILHLEKNKTQAKKKKRKKIRVYPTCKLNKSSYTFNTYFIDDPLHEVKLSLQ